MYEAQIRNQYTFGNTTIRRNTLQEIKDELKKRYIDICATVKVYEMKEVPINSDWYEIFDSSKMEMKEEYYNKSLYNEACIYKDQVVYKQ